jgi:hypothetical protein
MKNSIQRSTGLVLLFLVASCSGASFSPGSRANQFIANAHGGEFNATSAGSDTFSDCTASANGHFKFLGDGRGSYLHVVTEIGKMKGERSGNHCVWSGNATLTSQRRPHDSVTFSLGLNGSRYHNPCNNALGYVVKRGTGRFTQASGYGTVTFTCTGSGYSDEWSGTLNF